MCLKIDGDIARFVTGLAVEILVMQLTSTNKQNIFLESEVCDFPSRMITIGRCVRKLS